MVTVEYIFHDSFLIAVDGVGAFLFDYWKENEERFRLRSSEQTIPACLDRLDRDMPLYIFISHHHKDHYNAGLFRWAKEFPKALIFVSNDVRKFSRYIVSDPDISRQVVVLKRGETYVNGEITVSAFGSTDIGNSYMVELNRFGRKIFHAGDLNNWSWLDESTEEEIRKMEGDFLAVLRDIREKTERIWIAMFPVDSRLGREYYRGAKQFLEHFEVENFFPMHFGLGETAEESERLKFDARQFRLYASSTTGACIALQAPGDTWGSNAVFRNSDPSL